MKDDLTTEELLLAALIDRRARELRATSPTTDQPASRTQQRDQFIAQALHELQDTAQRLRKLRT